MFIMPYKLGHEIRTQEEKSSFTIREGGKISISVEIIYPTDVRNVKNSLKLKKVREIGDLPECGGIRTSMTQSKEIKVENQDNQNED